MKCTQNTEVREAVAEKPGLPPTQTNLLHAGSAAQLWDTRCHHSWLPFLACLGSLVCHTGANKEPPSTMVPETEQSNGTEGPVSGGGSDHRCRSIRLREEVWTSHGAAADRPASAPGWAGEQDQPTRPGVATAAYRQPGWLQPEQQP